MDTFCSKCGRTEVVLPVKGFDKTTGKPNTERQCSSGLCGHDGVRHSYRTSVWVGTETCVKCGNVRAQGGMW